MADSSDPDEALQAGGGEWADVHPQDVAAVLADVARKLLAAKTLQGTLQRIVDLSVEVIHGADYAGISLVEGVAVTTPASTDRLVTELDELQATLAEGPCVDAIRRHASVHTDDLSTERRWSRFAPEAARRDMRSLLVYRLFVEEDTLGALSLYSRQEAAFSDADQDLALLFAAHAAMALSTAGAHAANLERVLQFDTARHAEEMVGLATGIIMERRGISAKEAHHMLSRAARRFNMQLATVAARVVESPGNA
jgi:GAF domain-containing protein